MELLGSIYNIFLKDDSWLTLLKGLGATVQISALSLFWGTLLGAAICFFRMGNWPLVTGAAKAYIALLRGSPVLMLLMLLYYGVFARSGLSPLAVAIITFSLHTAAHVAEIIRAAISATEKGQVEAARTLGFSRWQAFRFVTLPQMVRIAKPVYQSAVINLIQWTSVVGYVTITDLTRVINNIAARTMQPFITITVGMVIYIAMSYAVNAIFAFSDWWPQRHRGGETP